MGMLAYMGQGKAPAVADPGQDGPPTTRAAAIDSIRKSKIRVMRTPGKYLRMLPWIDQSLQDTPAARTAYRQMLRSPFVKSALLSKVFSVGTLDLTVAPADPKNPKDRIVAEFCRAMTLRMSDGEYGLSGLGGIVSSLLLPGLVDGYCIGAKKGTQVELGEYAGKWTYSSLESKHPDLYAFDVDEYGKITSVVGMGQAFGERYDPSGFVIWQYLALYGNPFGMSDLAAAYQAFWRMDTAWKLRHTNIKNQNGPFLLGKYPSTQSELKDVIGDTLEAAQAGGYAVVPNDVEVQVTKLAAADEGAFKSAIADLKEEIILSISWAVLQSVEGDKTGSRAGMQVHQSQSELAVWYLAEAVTSILNKQVYPDLCRLNYVGYSDYPKATLGGVNDDDMKGSVEVDTFLASIDYPFSAEDISRRYRRPMAVDASDLLRRRQPDPQMLPGGSGQQGGDPNQPPRKPMIALPPGGAADRPFDRASEADTFAETDPEVAGPAGAADHIETLTAKAIDDGSSMLTRLCRTAFARVTGNTVTRLFSADELKELAAAFAATRATAELLGRARVRQMYAAKEDLQFSEEHQPIKFDDTRPPDAPPPESLPLMQPEEAISYFQNLYPSLSPLPTFTARLLRESFTLAVNTEHTLLQSVKDAVADSLFHGGTVLEGATKIRNLLEAAGVGRSPAYAEMVFRTNAMDAYVAGYEAERTDPDVIEAFPVWRWDGVGDGRERPAHLARNGKYYPAYVGFNEVRTNKPEERICCRCVPTAIYKSDWAKLQKDGATLQTSW